MSNDSSFAKTVAETAMRLNEVLSVLPRNDSLPEELPRGADIPADLDPLADGVLMEHQKEWLEDRSDLKLGEKGRRTGITFAEALDDTLIAAAARSAGGSNVFYIGDTKDKGREFIGYVAHFAKIIAGELGTIEEFLFEDQKEDGTSKYISAYRVSFASGYRIEALSSRPENIRGLQGIVIIDEAAFHKDVRQVLDAVNALLIWGGKIRIISTHNGTLNPFNELIQEAKAGKVPYSCHFIPFQKAVDNGLYRRVCLIKGIEYTKEDEEAWEAKIRGSYGVRTAAMKQELDGIPADSEGAALTRVQIEACMMNDIPVIRWRCKDEFKNAPKHIRKADTEDFCEGELLPVLEKLDPTRPHYFGEDFARSGDTTAITVFELSRSLKRITKLVVELRNVPFEQQKQVLFYIGDRLPRFSGGALDKTGNGAYLAEVATQKWGEHRIIEVAFSQEWYRQNMPPYIAAFSDQDVILPKDDDILRDHQSLAYINGIIKVPDDMRFKGSDGFERHGDTAISGALAWFVSSQFSPTEYDYIPVSKLNDLEGGDMFETGSKGRVLW